MRVASSGDGEDGKHGQVMPASPLAWRRAAEGRRPRAGWQGGVGTCGREKAHGALAILVFLLASILPRAATVALRAV